MDFKYFKSPEDEPKYNLSSQITFIEILSVICHNVQ